MNKVTSIADNIHESIQVSGLEKDVLSTRAFNRLHNVLQTSTMYLTYPGARHSRFSHSLGVMHLAGRMFVRGLANAQDCVPEFLERVWEELVQLSRASRFLEQVSHVPSRLEDDAIHTEFEDLDQPILEHPFYPRPPFLHNSTVKDLNAFLTAYQAIRLAGLLHDAGHLPFSHVAEFALFDLAGTLGEATTRTPNQTEFLKIINGLGLGEGDHKFHEPIGVHISENILTRAAMRARSRQEWYNLLLVSYYALVIISKSRILGDEEAEGPDGDIPMSTAVFCIRSIIDGTIDADRLDFVPRDRTMCGLGRPIHTERIVQFYTLVRRATSPHTPFRFLPSARSISGIEEVLERRFEFYQYAVSHHRVKKTDGLLRRSVARIAAGALARKPRSPRRGGSATLRIDIEGLWQPFKSYQQAIAGGSPTDFARMVSQWDDAWLVTLLRNHFEEHQAKNPDDADFDGTLRAMLDELLSGRRQYRSLMKRLDHFWTMDQALREKAEMFDWAGRFPYPEAFDKKQREDHAEHLLSPHRGLFTNALKEHLRVTGWDDHWSHLVRHAVEGLRRNGFDDAFHAENGFGSGVSIKDEVVFDSGAGDSTIEIREVSDIAHRLKERHRFIPPFYVYVLGGLDADADINRKAVGHLVWHAFEELIVNPSNKDTREA